MPTRDQTMSHFGPKLLEALALMTLDEINVLRAQLGLPPRTGQQLLDQINNHLSTLPDYDWMTEEP